jgi:hypothetical protein
LRKAKSYYEQFPRRTLFVVIHAVNRDQVLRNAFIARDAGADGIFLINHQIRWSLLWDIYFKVRRLHPKWFVGLNFLDLSTAAAIENVPGSASALWVDDAGISQPATDVVDTQQADEYQALRTRRRNEDESHSLYFGSIAFKGQKAVTSPGPVAYQAAQLMDVVVTSGPATGVPPTLEKMQEIRRWAPRIPLAIASGITAENIGPFLPLVDCFMVATGISDSHTELNPQKTRQLADTIHTAPCRHS